MRHSFRHALLKTWQVESIMLRFCGIYFFSSVRCAHVETRLSAAYLVNLVCPQVEPRMILRTDWSLSLSLSDESWRAWRHGLFFFSHLPRELWDFFIYDHFQVTSHLVKILFAYWLYSGGTVCNCTMFQQTFKYIEYE